MSRITARSFWKENTLYMVTFLVIWSIICASLLLGVEKGEAIIFFSDNRSDGLNYFFRFCTHIGEGYVYLLAVVAFLFVHYAKSIAIILNSFLVLATSVPLKAFFKHHRPKRYFEEYLNQPELINYVPDVILHDGYTSSFPSGHTTSGFAFYTLLAFFIPNKYVKLLCLLAAFLVGLSRVYLVQHFLKDVVAGSMLGFLVALFTYWLTQKFEHRFSGKYIRKSKRMKEKLEN
jgi:membrane-associated phospholipid phosphatase